MFCRQNRNKHKFQYYFHVKYILIFPKQKNIKYWQSQLVMKCMLNLLYREDQEMKKNSIVPQKLLHILPQVKQLIPIKRCLAITYIVRQLQKRHSNIQLLAHHYILFWNTMQIYCLKIYIYTYLTTYGLQKKPCICISSTCRYL